MRQAQARLEHTAEVEEKPAENSATKKLHETRSAKRNEFPPDEPEGFKIAGFPWQFVLTMSLIALGVLGLIAKALGL